MNQRMQSTILGAGERKDLHLPEKSLFKSELIHDCQLKNANLSSPIFEDCRFDHCVFEKCDFRGARFFYQTALNNCLFKHADLSGAGLSNSRFTDCTFVRCDFRQTSLKECSFMNCTFENCKIIDNTFNAADIRDCRFSGKLQETSFIAEQPDTLLLIDFERCILDCVIFKNCNLEQVVPPADARHLYFPDLPQRASRALAWLSTQGDNPDNKILRRRLKNYELQRGGIFNLTSLTETEGKDVAGQLIELLTLPEH